MRDTKEIQGSGQTPDGAGPTADALRTALFQRAARTGHTAWLTFRNPLRGFGKDALYPLGFKAAANELVEHLAEESGPTHLSGALVYAVFYNYRHYLELRLKNSISGVSGLLGRAEVPRLRGARGHDLMRLWAILRGLLEEVNGEHRFRGKYDAIETYLQVMHDLDPGSTSFRYPDEQFFVPAGVECINLKRLREHVAELSDLLDKTWLC